MIDKNFEIYLARVEQEEKNVRKKSPTNFSKNTQKIRSGLARVKSFTELICPGVCYSGFKLSIRSGFKN